MYIWSNQKFPRLFLITESTFMMRKLSLKIICMRETAGKNRLGKNVYLYNFNHFIDMLICDSLAYF